MCTHDDAPDDWKPIGVVASEFVAGLAARRKGAKPAALYEDAGGVISGAIETDSARDWSVPKIVCASPAPRATNGLSRPAKSPGGRHPSCLTVPIPVNFKRLLRRIRS